MLKVCLLCVFFSFILDVRLVDVPVGVTQEEGHKGFLIHLPSAVLAIIFLARRIQLFLSLVDREVEFIVFHLLGVFCFCFLRGKSLLPELELNHRGDRFTSVHIFIEFSYKLVPQRFLESGMFKEKSEHT